MTINLSPPEEFAIRHGLPETGRDYRNDDGTVNRAHIDDQIHNSPHYNPVGRTRIDREYEGDNEMTGWYVP